MAVETQPSRPKSVLKELSGQGWQALNPTTDAQEASDEQIIGNYKGQPIKVGFRIEEVAFEEDELLHEVYRTGRYDVHLKIETLGQGMAQGQVKVEEADGYGTD